MLKSKLEPASRNQLANVNNEYQDHYRRVLCVCSAGLLRSPTLATVLNKEFDYNTRAAGLTSEYALVPVTHALLAWAQEVVCMDHFQKQQLESYMDDLQLSRVPVYNLAVRDEYNYGSDQLKDELLCAYNRVTAPKDDEDSK